MFPVLGLISGAGFRADSEEDEEEGVVGSRLVSKMTTVTKSKPKRDSTTESRKP